MLGADSCRADPLLVNINAHLQDNLDCRPATHVMAVYRNASVFPGMDHLILADPLICIHHAVMRLLVEIDDVLEANVVTLVVATQTRVRVMACFGEVSMQMVTVVHLDLVPLEQLLKLFIANGVVLNIDTHCLHNVINVLLANEHMIDLEAATMDKQLCHFVLVHTLSVTVVVLPASMTQVLRLRLQMFNDYRLAWADVETIDFDTLAKEKRNSFLILNLNMRVHMDTLTFPEFI